MARNQTINQKLNEKDFLNQFGNAVPGHKNEQLPRNSRECSNPINPICWNKYVGTKLTNNEDYSELSEPQKLSNTPWDVATLLSIKKKNLKKYQIQYGVSQRLNLVVMLTCFNCM